MIRDGIRPWIAERLYGEIMSKPMFMITDEELRDLDQLDRVRRLKVEEGPRLTQEEWEEIKSRVVQ